MASRNKSLSRFSYAFYPVLSFPEPCALLLFGPEEKRATPVHSVRLAGVAAYGTRKRATSHAAFGPIQIQI